MLRRLVDLVDFLVEVACGVHVGRAHHVGLAVLPRDDGGEDVVVIRVGEGACDRVAFAYLDRDVMRLHPAPLTVVAIAEGVGGVDLDLVAVGDIGGAGGHPPGHVAGVREDEHGAERVPGRVEIAGVNARFVGEGAIDPAVRVAEHDLGARPGAPRGKDPLVGGVPAGPGDRRAVGSRELDAAAGAVLHALPGLIPRPQHEAGQHHRVPGLEVGRPAGRAVGVLGHPGLHPRDVVGVVRLQLGTEPVPARLRLLDVPPHARLDVRGDCVRAARPRDAAGGPVPECRRHFTAPRKEHAEDEFELILGLRVPETVEARLLDIGDDVRDAPGVAVDGDLGGGRRDDGPVGGGIARLGLGLRSADRQERRADRESADGVHGTLSS